MAPRSRHPLSPSLRDALARLGAALHDGEAPAGLLDEALAGIAALPPEAAPRADGAIAKAARLWQVHPARRLGWPPGSWRFGEPMQGLRERTPQLDRLFLFHRDGYLREGALRSLDGPLDGPFLAAAVLLRLNDWVPQVRRAASACAGRAFPLTPGPILARALLGLSGPMDRWERWGGPPPVLAATLARPDVAAARAELIRQGGFGGVASAFRRALRTPDLDPDLAMLAAEARQPAVRAIALETLLEGRAAWVTGHERAWVDKTMGLSRRRPVFGTRPVARPEPPDALIDRGLADAAAAVRRVAADGAVLHRDALADRAAVARRLLADPSAAVRARGEILRGPDSGASAAEG